MPHRSEQRALAKALWRLGIRNPYVLYKRWHIPYKTAYRYIKRLNRGESLEDRPRAGRPRKLTSRLRRQLAQLKSKDPKKKAAFFARRLSEINDTPVGVDTVRRALHELGYNWRLRAKRKLTSAQKRERVAFAQAHLHDSWQHRWFFDESYFNLYRHGNRYWVRAETDDAFSKPKLTWAQEKVSVGIAVAIRHGRKSALAFLPKNWSGTDLVRVWEETLLASLQWKSAGRERNELVIDNDGRHFTAGWKAFAERCRLSPIRPWPANSPDLNSIENAFAWLKAKVEDMEPHDEPSLREAITRAWQDFPVEMTERLAESLPRRLASCLQRKGGRTKY
jgi:transposase